ncbi:MAG: D-aminoacyl-tRNA deacylase [Cardiobacteriaceae bacterium]|nr:D-aminoacyl-tRNA deacylase [Cardiobacteriaceae bacterium]
MKALIQRCQSAFVEVEGKRIAEIGKGMLVLLALEKGDSEAMFEKAQQKILNYRMFADEADKMNLNVVQSEGEILLVSQFTLAANTAKGLRPSFDPAMPPALAQSAFETFARGLKAHYPRVQTGQFGANMQVGLVNDGPVTFWLTW